MPLYHCDNCDHEWEGLDNNICDWCGGEGYMLEEETCFEKFCKEIVKDETKRKIFKALRQKGHLKA